MATYPEMSREFTKLVSDPVTWIKDHPRGLGLIEIPIPRELQRSLARLPSEYKDGLLVGMIFTGGVLQRDLHRIQKRYKKQRASAHAATQILKETVKQNSLAQTSDPQHVKSAICDICRENQIQQATQCGHTFCTECLCRWKEEQGTCPKCRRPVEPVLELFL